MTEFTLDTDAGRETEHAWLDLLAVGPSLETLRSDPSWTRVTTVGSEADPLSFAERSILRALIGLSVAVVIDPVTDLLIEGSTATARVQETTLIDGAITVVVIAVANLIGRL